MNKISSFRGEYSFLSNFYQCPVLYNGITYLNAEAAFQAQKTLNEMRRHGFSNVSAIEAKKMGKFVQLREDWDSIKLTVMEEVIRAKFSQNKELKNKLLQTEGMYIEEGNTWGDVFWGKVYGIGENHLGIILMNIRNEFLNEFLKEN